FSRLAWRSLALRPAHSRGHQLVTAIRRLQPFRYLHDCSDCFRLERSAGWALHPLESAALSRRTWKPDLQRHERDTAVRHKLPLLCVISLNGGWTADPEGHTPAASPATRAITR